LQAVNKISNRILESKLETACPIYLKSRKYKLKYYGKSSYLEEQSKESEHQTKGGNDRSSSSEAVGVVSGLDETITTTSDSVLVKELVGGVEGTAAQLLAIRSTAVECGVSVGVRARSHITASSNEGLVELGAQTDLAVIGSIEEATRDLIRPAKTKTKVSTNKNTYFKKSGLHS
jgi:hypothetical protein